MSTVIRTAGLPGQPDLAPGYITLSYDEHLDAYEDRIDLERGYGTRDGTSEETYSVYRGGPGFGTFERAVNNAITIEQAARWWDEYRDDVGVLKYRALWAVDEETETRRAHPEPVTREDLRRLLSRDNPVDDRRQAIAIEYAIRDGLLRDGADGGLHLTDVGEDTLHAAHQPDRLGETAAPAATARRLAAASFGSPTPAGEPSPAVAPTMEPAAALLRREGPSRGGR